ncbi:MULTISPECIES: hypothetical protein [unclassified Bradyrhizobium]|uniref:hypothetical protein n=1 Tax=unclassified Bradyrhizobium TaxID=2631580 RepID=UPI0020122129|nr:MULTISPECIES: hypothetical protein [unclassified Bradyrhizobium]
MIWGLVCAIAALLLYVLVLRPILRAVPALKAFYADADTFWQKAWALAWRSLTVAWSYLLALVGALFQAIDSIGDALGDPGLKDQIAAAIGDARTVGRILLGISIVTLVARLRSIRKG